MNKISSLKRNKLIKRAVEIIMDTPEGLFSTVDFLGMPHTRWMVGVPDEGISPIYTLTSVDSRKVKHIRECPKVCWLFSTPHQADVVTLYGQARVLESMKVRALERAWDRLIQGANANVMGPVNNPTRYCAIETVVERCEFISSGMGIITPQLLYRCD